MTSPGEIIKEIEAHWANCQKTSFGMGPGRIDYLILRVKRLTAALEEIKLGRGPYKEGQLEHADACITAMKEEARKALESDE